MPNSSALAVTRRAFLHRGALALASAAGASAAVRRLLGREEKAEDPSLRIGVLADVHYADKPASGNRAYRESIPRIREAVKRFAERKAEIAIELGDFIDEAETPEGELAQLKAIEAELAAFPGERYHVLGNHCIWTLTKEEFLGAVGAREAHHSFDRGGFHLVVLDACYRSDGVPYGRRNNEWTDADVPPAEREWLAEDLAKTDKRAIVFIHHRLDVDTGYAIRSAAAVRKILESSGKVIAVFQGHNHLNDHREIGGIHYVTLAAMVEGSGKESGAHGILEAYRDGSLLLDGYHEQEDRSLGARARRSIRV